ncbi:trypsin-like peptidase domain-containing protein [Candidatus Uhrbacteria bacterium]|nr:trypsin-like peptidase domain-containing protein [Candidatus Uhrbacteria bacterium]
MQPRALSGLLLVATICAGFVSGAAGGYFVVVQNEARLTEPQSSIMTQRDEEESVADLVERVMPSVVSIDVLSKEGEDPFGDRWVNERGREQIAGGSGFFVSSDGLIVTNRHVLDGKDVEYEVVTSDGRAYPAQVLAIDSVLDLAVLKVEGTGFPALQLGDSDTVRPGQSVIAIGNTLAEFQNSVTMGIVSGVNRRLWAGEDEATAEILEEAIQTDAPINLGNSGGPLIDLDGRVIGVNTAVGEAQSLGFALPSNAVRRAVDSVRQFGRIVRPWIGIRYDMEDGGARVAEGTRQEPGIIAGSPADKAGLKPGDLIVSFERDALDADHPLAGRMAKYNPGDVVTLEVERGGEVVNIHLTLGDRESIE